ncbi:MAG: DsbA family oxidoreductase [Proteobacteria bacterium]|nr:DsbA family oxidoreductase [Pseudomonadota bacterium]
MTFPIDVISDVVCPWCYVGKRRLEAALAGLAATNPELEPVVSWHPFALNPGLPAGGAPRKAWMDAKFGGAERVRAAHERLEAIGAGVGIPFAFDRITVQPDTLDAHRLIAWAQAQGEDAGEIVERLFAAFFVEGRDIGDRAVLAAIAAEAKLDGVAARAYLDSGAGSDAIRDSERRAQALGVGGVPFFIFGEKLAVSGAQEVQTLMDAIDQARVA